MGSESRSHIAERQARVLRLNSRPVVFFSANPWRARVGMVLAMVGTAVLFGLLARPDWLVVVLERLAH